MDVAPKKLKMDWVGSLSALTLKKGERRVTGQVEEGFIPQYGSLSQLDGSCSRIWTKAVHRAVVFSPILKVLINLV